MEHMDKTQIKFEKYHWDNPHLYKLFVELATQVKNAGFNKYSMWAIVNQVRWHFDIELKNAGEFKISNDYISRYARLIMANEPYLKDFFSIKKLKRQNENSTVFSVVA